MLARLAYGLPLPPDASGTLTLTLHAPYTDAEGRTAQAVTSADLTPNEFGWAQAVMDGVPVTLVVQGEGDPPAPLATVSATVTLPGREASTSEWTVALTANRAGVLDVVELPTSEDPRVTALLAEARAVLDEARRVPTPAAPDTQALEALEAAIAAADAAQAQFKALLVQATNTFNELEARGQRAIAALNVLARKESES